MDKKGEMFMELAICAIVIGVVIMVGYLVITQVKSGLIANTTNYNATSVSGITDSTIFSGFGLVAVGIIILMAFGIISIFSNGSYTESTYIRKEEKEEQPKKQKTRKVFY